MIGSAKLARRVRVVAAMGALLLLSQLVTAPAEAWWRRGVWVTVPGPVLVGPPAYYPPPPAYYPPPPVYYAPPSMVYAQPPVYAPPPGYVPGALPPPAYATRPGRTCYVIAQSCPLNAEYPPGTTCACPAGRGTVYGKVG